MGDWPAVTIVSLLKYHGLGNDFLIALDASDFPQPLEALEIDKETVTRLCDRRRGIGADGLIVARAPVAGGSVSMELRNADGGRAETSGNGLRCLALALVDSGSVASAAVLIETDAGSVMARVGPRGTDGCAEVELSMGVASVGPSVRPAPLLGEAFVARTVDIGNPHLVLLGPSLGGVEIDDIGSRLEGARAGGQNVEIVAPDGRGGLDLVVWERGVGRTEACGSGSCAAAAAARACGLVADRVTVRNPGGVLTVELVGSLTEPAVALSGPACRIGRAEVDFDLGRTR
ncbi:MAG: diaminopimelate epimerase [Acidimicrobiales bacterium]